MLASVSGFEWQLGAIDAAAFFEHLKSVHGVERQIGKIPRLMFFSKSGNFHTGLLITIRDQRKFLELQQSGKSYLLAIRESEPGSRPMEFNYFIFHPILKRGLYLQYRGACGLRNFGTLMRKLYNEAMAKDKRDELAALDASGKSTRASRGAIASKYKPGQFTHWPLMSKEKIEELIDKMSRIQRFSWTYAKPEVREPMFKSVDSFVTTVKGELSFSPTTSTPSKVKRAITDFIKKASPKRGTIHGFDNRGAEKNYPLQIHPEVYQQYDWDTLVGNEDLKTDDINSTNAIAELLAVAIKKPAIFGKP